MTQWGDKISAQGEVTPLSCQGRPSQYARGLGWPGQRNSLGEWGHGRNLGGIALCPVTQTSWQQGLPGGQGEAGIRPGPEGAVSRGRCGWDRRAQLARLAG